MKQVNIHSLHSQQGAVLIVGLIMLFSLTMLGVGAMSSNLLQQRMATNMGDMAIAFNSADTLLRERQKWLVDISSEPVVKSTCNADQDCIYDAREKKSLLATNYGDEWWNNPLTMSQSWWNANAQEYGTASTVDLANVASDARIAIEWLQTESDSLQEGETTTKSGITYYQMTVRGTGSTDLSEVVLQATVSKRFN